jgi:high-affinity nickel-transport protein
MTRKQASSSETSAGRALRRAPARLRVSGAHELKFRIMVIFGLLAVLNAGVWLWAVAVFHGHPALLGIALMIYGLGLRHAVDADHIAAIDNVTRKLMQERKCPASVGFFFAMGHSAVIVIVTAIVASATTMLGRIESLRDVGGTISTSVSALFLIVIAAMNLVVFFSIYKRYRSIRSGGSLVEEDLDVLLNSRGFLARIFRSLFRLVTKSWHMFPLGFLFGLGFDTATEIAMFGISAAQAAKGLAFGAILVFPMLFAAGMSLVDTMDGVLMLGAYNWAFVKPVRKLYYNMTITLVSVVIALLIGGIETLGLFASKFDLDGAFWQGIRMLNGQFNQLGFVIIGVFVVAWLISCLLYRLRGIERLELQVAGLPVFRDGGGEASAGTRA